jgi:hypothetical protein
MAAMEVMVAEVEGEALMGPLAMVETVLRLFDFTFEV